MNMDHVVRTSLKRDHEYLDMGTLQGANTLWLLAEQCRVLCSVVGSSENRSHPKGSLMLCARFPQIQMEPSVCTLHSLRMGFGTNSGSLQIRTNRAVPPGIVRAVLSSVAHSSWQTI